METTKKPQGLEQSVSIREGSFMSNVFFDKVNIVKLFILALIAVLLPLLASFSSVTNSRYNYFKKDSVAEDEVLGVDEAVCQENEICGMVGLEGCVAREECLENEFACGEGEDMVCCDKGECQECSPCVDGFQEEPNECGEVQKSCESVDCRGGVCGKVEKTCYPLKYKVTYSTKEGKCPDPEEVCSSTANKAPECSSDSSILKEYTLLNGICEGFDNKTGICDKVVENLEVGVVWEEAVLRSANLTGSKGGIGIRAMTAPSISSVSPTNYSFLGGGSMTINVSNILDTFGFTTVSGGGGHTCGIGIDENMYCWGYNTSGELGNGTTTGSSVPVKVNTSIKFTQITLGTYHTCGLDVNGKAYCWGNNSNGQLGNNSTTNSSVPVAVSTPSLVPQGFGYTSITGDGNHTCAIGNNNKAYCWGSNSNGQLGNGNTTDRLVPTAVSQGAIPAGVTLTSIDAGYLHTCAIGSNNKGYCWGYNLYGRLGDGTTTQRTTPVAVSQGAIPAGVTFKAIQAGREHSCMLSSDSYSNPYCWGRNSKGQLGDGTTTQRTTPVAVNTSGFTEPYLSNMSLGDNHACVLGQFSPFDSNRGAYCWGEGTYGQIGNGSTANRTIPVAVSRGSIPTGVTQTFLSVGLYHSCTLGNDNKVYCWGAGSEGRLGNGGTSDALQPVAVLPGENANNKLYEINIGNNILMRELDPGATSIQISPIPAHISGNVSISIKRLADNVSSNSVSFTYNNLPGPSISNINPSTINQTGGQTVNITGSNFLDYGPFNTLSKISSGGSHSCGIDTGGQGYCWGSNSSGQLGNGTTTQSASPVAVSQGAIPSNVTLSSIGAGTSHTCVIGSNNKGYCWGYNNFGQLGDGSTTQRTIPVAVSQGAIPASVTFSSISSGGAHTCAIGSNNKGYCWGDNGYRQLGDGTTTQRTTPVAVSQGAIPVGVTFSSISAGSSHTCAIGSNGNAYCWGFNSSGQLGDGSTTQRATPVAVSMPFSITFSSISCGNTHTCAIGSNGKAYCWGSNSNGQLGNGGTAQSTTPVLVSQGAVPSGVTLSSISTGNTHTCAIASNGTIYCWGYNNYGQLGDGSTTQSTIPVAVSQGAIPSGVTLSSIGAGSSHNCAVGSNGQGYCWGLNNYGQLGNDETATRPTPSYVLKKQNPTIEFGTTPATSTTYTSTSAMSAVTPSLSVTGYISVKLTNPDGQYATRSINVIGLPSVPQNLGATAGNTQVSLTWTAPSSNGGSAITDYIVQYSTNGLTWTTFNDGVSTSTSTTVTGLTNGTLYYFRVAAVNSVGTGPYTSSVSATPINQAPTFTAVSNDSPALPGETVIWSTTASDTDGQVKLLVCKTAWIANGVCVEGSWCTSNLVNNNPSCSYSVPNPTSVGTYNAYVYILDNQNEPATGSLQGSNKSFVVNSVAPTVVNVSLNGGSAIDLVENSTKAVNLTAQVVSQNTCSSIGTVKGYVYRSGVGYTGCDTLAEGNDNHCYPEISCTLDANSCTDPTASSANYTCTVNIQFHADPTDSNVTYATENWLATVVAANTSSQTGVGHLSTGVEMNSLLGITITSSLDYGDMLVGQSSTPYLNRVITSVPAGNVPMNQEHRGEGTGMCTDFSVSPPTCGGATPIPLSSQRYSLNSTTAYSSGTPLTGSAASVLIDIPKATSTNPTGKNVWWGIEIPNNTAVGQYNGMVSVIPTKKNI